VVIRGGSRLHQQPYPPGCHFYEVFGMPSYEPGVLLPPPDSFERPLDLPIRHASLIDPEAGFLYPEVSQELEGFSVSTAPCGHHQVNGISTPSLDEAVPAAVGPVAEAGRVVAPVQKAPPSIFPGFSSQGRYESFHFVAVEDDHFRASLRRSS